MPNAMTRDKVIALAMEYAREAGCTCEPTVTLPSRAERRRLQLQAPVFVLHQDGCPAPENSQIQIHPKEIE
jgi:hypothetical protein